MTRFLRISTTYPWLILACILIVTLALGSKLSDLRIEISAESLAVEGDPAWIAYQKSLVDFDDSAISVVLFEDPDLFTTDKLTIIKQAVEALTDLPDVVQATSLFSVANIRLEDEFVTTKPFLEKIPESENDLQQILQQARLNPLVIDNLISNDGSVFAVNLTLRENADDRDFDHRISQSVEAILDKHRPQFNSIIQIGSPYIRDSISQKITTDQINIMPWAIGILVLTLAIGIRNLSGAFIPLITSAISIVWTLAGMVLLDVPIGVMTSIVPALLIIIGSTEDIHIIAEYKARRALGLSTDEALEQMSNAIGTAILLTFITTYFGFISIYTNEIRLLQEFGLVASSGLLINFVVTSLTVPAILKILPQRKITREGRVTTKLNLYQRVSLGLFNLVLRHSKSTVLILTLITIASVYGALTLKINNNPLGYFKNDTQVVINSNRVHETLSGIQTFSVILETGIEDTFKKVRYLQEIEKIQDFLDQSDSFDKSLSFNDFMKVIHVAMEGDEVQQLGELYLPDSDDLVRDYTLFTKHELFKSYVTRNFSSARIMVRHNINDSSDLKKAVEQLDAFVRDNIDPALKVKITGASIVRANGADYMASGQAKSLLLMSLVIISVIAILFVNWKAGVVALIPNLFPIVVLFGVMGFSGISLDTGTAMVAVIALGISVDDTVHFMTRYHYNTRNRNDPEVALKDTVLDESVPIITTSLALMAGFASLSLSSFVPIENFGLLSALVMLLALITTFVITPLLLSNTALVTMWDMLSLKLQAQVVNDCALFKGLSPWQIKQAILSSEVKFYQPDDIIISQGSIGDEMYVVLEGQVKVKMIQEDGTVVTVNKISEGGLFGEIALVSQIPRTADVIASSHTRLLAIHWESMQKFSRLHTRIAALLFQNLASIVGQRLASTDSMTVLRDENTGAVNRAFFRELIELEALRSQRHKEPLTFICFTLLLKLDNREFNSMLNQLSEKVRGGTRKIDIYARWGDHRFVILLPRTTGQDGSRIAERIQQNAMRLLSCYKDNKCLKMTVWTYEGDDDIDALLQQTEAILNQPIPES